MRRNYRTLLAGMRPLDRWQKVTTRTGLMVHIAAGRGALCGAAWHNKTEVTDLPVTCSVCKDRLPKYRLAMQQVIEARERYRDSDNLPIREATMTELDNGLLQMTELEKEIREQDE